MDSTLSGIKGVMVRVDDILVATSGGVTTHVGVIKQVFSRLAKLNVKLKNGPKCQFFQVQVKYMGHILSKQGISPVNSKLDAVRLAPRPKDVSQLRSFLAMLDYSKFTKDISSQLHPLYQLLSNKIEWFWTKECETAFIWAEEVLSSNQVWFIMTPKNLSF